MLEYERALQQRVPRGVREALNLPREAKWATVLAQVVLRFGAKGNLAAIQEIRESTDGRAPQRVELTGAIQEERYDFSKFSDEDLDRLEEILTRAAEATKPQ